VHHRCPAPAHARHPRPMGGSHQMQSEAIRGHHQKPSEANEWRSWRSS
jgi:hypothetical protein